MDVERIDLIARRHFRVYETRDEEFYGQVVARLHFLQFPPEEFDERYEAVRRDLKDLDEELLVFIRREGGEDILFVAPRPDLLPEKIHINVTLLVLTVLTTLGAGAMYWNGYHNAGGDWSWSIFWRPENLLWGGLTFALPLMAILALHESAHYLAARRHGLRASLPFFIPMPPPAFLFGTLGAFIRLRDPLPDRKALLDVGASGPIAGFALAVPIIIAGAFLTQDAAVEVPDLDRPELLLDHAWVLQESGTGEFRYHHSAPQAGVETFTLVAPDEETWRVEGTVTITLQNGTELEDTFSASMAAGEESQRSIRVPDNASTALLVLEWDDGLVSFGDPLIVKAFSWAFDTDEYLTHPTFFAGWVGMLITGINLLPAGQLDGGHVARAVFGDRMHVAGYISVGLLIWLSFQFSAWILMAVFVMLTGIRHPPPLNDRTDLDARRKFVAVAVLAVFALTFIPVPIVF